MRLVVIRVEPTRSSTSQVLMTIWPRQLKQTSDGRIPWDTAGWTHAPEHCRSIVGAELAIEWSARSGYVTGEQSAVSRSGPEDILRPDLCRRTAGRISDWQGHHEQPWAPRAPWAGRHHSVLHHVPYIPPWMSHLRWHHHHRHHSHHSYNSHQN